MPYITHIRTGELRGIAPLEIDLQPDEGRPFRHLVLTGPNGTGKTSILAAIAGELHVNSSGLSSLSEDDVDNPISMLQKVFASGNGSIASHLVYGHAELTWTVRLHELAEAFKSGHTIGCYLHARRGIEFEDVESISSERISVTPLTNPSGSKFLQFLVNRKAQQSFARDDGDETTTKQLGQWFHDLERGLAQLLGEDQLHLEFDRKELTFYMEVGDQRYDMRSLAHGHASAIGVLAEILMRVELSHDEPDHQHDSGVVLIDEPETHLHLELQERILPAITTMFPHLQLIVATHSPAVVTSIDNAIVFDLEDRQPRRSEALRGHTYGWIMKRHFGLEEDFDLETTEQLRELDQLRHQDTLSPEQQSRLEQLAEQLASRSHALALEVWNRVLAARLHQRAQPEGAE